METPSQDAKDKAWCHRLKLETKKELGPKQGHKHTTPHKDSRLLPVPFQPLFLVPDPILHPCAHSHSPCRWSLSLTILPPQCLCHFSMSRAHTQQVLDRQLCIEVKTSQPPLPSWLAASIQDYSDNLPTCLSVHTSTRASVQEGCHSFSCHLMSQGFPGGLAVNTSASAEDGFDPWSRETPHAAEQLSPYTTVTEAHVLQSSWSTREVATMRSSFTTTRGQSPLDTRESQSSDDDPVKPIIIN